MGPLTLEEISRNNSLLFDDKLEYEETKRKFKDTFEYAGQKKDGKFNGIGRYVDNDNEIYEGQCEDGLWSGYGRKIYNDGSYYIGFWSGGIYNGKGKGFDKNGDLIIDDVFKDDKQN